MAATSSPAELAHGIIVITVYGNPPRRIVAQSVRVPKLIVEMVELALTTLPYAGVVKSVERES